MKTQRAALSLFAALVLLAAPAAAQDPAPDEPPPGFPARMLIQAMFAEPSALAHPAQIAVREREALRLTPEQVRRMREIEEEMLRPLLASLTETRDRQPLGIFFPGAQVDEDSLRAAFRRTADENAAAMIGMVHAVDRVYAALDPEQQRMLRRLQEEEVARVREREF